MPRKTIVITGIDGFLGKHLSTVARELDAEAKIVGIGRSKARDSSYETVSCDLLDANAVQEIFSHRVSPDYVFHLAGLLSDPDWHRLYQANVQTTLNLLQALKATQSSARVVIPGSAAEYGFPLPSALPISETHRINPASRYGVSKSWQSTLSLYYAFEGIGVVVARIFNVIGKGMSSRLSLGAFAGQLKDIQGMGSDGTIRVGNLSSRRDFLDVYDVCTALLQLAEAGRPGEAYNVCSGFSVSMQDLLEMMIRQLRVKIDIKVDPSKVRGGDVPDIFGSNEKLRNETKWAPKISISESISRLMSS